MMHQPISRRRLFQIGLGSLVLPVSRVMARADSVRLGVIADLHHGLAPTAMERLDVFMKAVRAEKPDAILQLGDFNFATSESKECLDLWRTFEGPRYHVLGNHDMDFMAKDAVVQAWGMPGRYYSFDFGNFHAVVLDRNNLKVNDEFIPYAEANFYVDTSLRGYADSRQLEWLRADLAATDLPTVVFVHQGLGLPTSMAEASSAIETVFEEHNRNAVRNKVVACFCGHHHIDRYSCKGGIHYVWINSASYYWVGEQYGRMAPYTRALYTFLTFHPDGVIEMDASHAEWEAPSPRERGFPGADELTTYIQARRLKMGDFVD